MRDVIRLELLTSCGRFLLYPRRATIPCLKLRQGGHRALPATRACWALVPARELHRQEAPVLGRQSMPEVVDEPMRAYAMSCSVSRARR